MLTYRHGVLTTVMESLGLEPVNMLWEYPMLSVIMAESWRGAAFPMVIFLGALQTIPTMLYEAAELDGAGAWRRFRDITLPLMSHLLAIVLLMTTITAMGSFLLIQILTNGEPGYGTETIALFAFHRAFVTLDTSLTYDKRKSANASDVLTACLTKCRPYSHGVKRTISSLIFDWTSWKTTRS